MIAVLKHGTTQEQIDHLITWLKHLDIEVHTGCCNHHIDDEEEDWFEEHLWHPFMHSLKLLAYILGTGLKI